MEIVADSGGIYALYDSSDHDHVRVRSLLRAERCTLHLPLTVLAEIDYLLNQRIGVSASLQFLEDILAGAYRLQSLDEHDFEVCHRLVSTYRDLNFGLADASVIALAERLHIDRILTVDERDFRVIRSAKGKAFTLLPADLDA